MKPLARILALLVLAAAAPAFAAQDETPVPTDKQKAKDARIEEYLRKKEERLAVKDTQRREAEAQAAAAQPEAAAPAAAGAAAAAPAAEAVKLPRELALAQDAVRRSSIGKDPTIERYLDLIDRQEANAHQLAAFANFLADAGLLPEALLYYSVALGLEREDPILWVNAGTLERRAGHLSQAASAFSRALQIDPNNALAHYNLGAVLDEQGRYEDAIEAYTVALTLEPSLGDPRVNPQAANNGRLLAVKLMLYKQQAGGLGTSLVDVPAGALSQQPAAEPQPEK